jgi:hypothetical protein
VVNLKAKDHGTKYNVMVREEFTIEAIRERAALESPVE